MNLVTLVLACSLYSDPSIPYAMAQIESHNQPLSIEVNGVSKQFKSENEAVSATRLALREGKRVNIGLMRVPSQWLPRVNAHADDLFRPCKNMVIATQILQQLQLQCETLARYQNNFNISACILSLYKTESLHRGNVYATKVLRFVQNHPFMRLAKKARDPGMIAATQPHKNVAHTHSRNSKQKTNI